MVYLKSYTLGEPFILSTWHDQLEESVVFVFVVFTVVFSRAILEPGNCHDPLSLGFLLLVTVG